jgi:hypothetical protein
MIVLIFTLDIDSLSNQMTLKLIIVTLSFNVCPSTQNKKKNQDVSGR